jgi:hypothetical protein
MRLFITTLILAVITTLPFIYGAELLRYLPRSLSQRIETAVQTVVPQPPAPIDSDTLTDVINSLRQQNNVRPLPQGQKTCLMANSALDNQQLDISIIAQKCPECRSVQIARFSQPFDAQWFENQVNQDASMRDYLFSSELTHICVATSSSEVAISLVSARTPTAAAPVQPVKASSFTEQQLWQALTIYRQSQNRTDIQQDENICKYARKRVSDHLTMISQGIKPEDYPVPDKYPLDAHQGFKSDAESELVFEITKKSHVAENLAYWPNAVDPIHVIEWGWDTSTEGHREAQISNEWTHGCLSGAEGFYVAIFAK